MAVVLNTIHDGPKNHVVHIGIAGANSDAVVVDASAINATSNPVTNLRLMRVEWGLDSAAGESALLEWDEDTDVTLFEFPEGEGEHDFTTIGGIPNPGGTGSTGDVLLTNAIGLANGSLVLYFKKS